jgi:hypothetical protein
MKEQLSIYRCPWCDITKPLRGLACHAGKTHKQSAEELHRQLFHNGQTPLCKCGCGQSVRWLQKRFGEYLRGHNSFSKEARDKAISVRRDMSARKELTSWNKGLSKETDARVAAQAIKISQAIDGNEMSKRLNARSPDEKKKHYTNLSNSLKKTYEHGRVPWNKNLTKEINVDLARAGSSISATRLNGFVPNRFTDDDVRELVSKARNFDIVEPLHYQNKYTKFKLKCRTCNDVTMKNVLMLKVTPTCFSCHPKESVGQIELYEFMRSICADAKLSDRTLPGVSEVDVYVPSKRFAVEYNGLFWHSEVAGKGPLYHQNKTDACGLLGISLMHVFEDDWRDRSDIVRSMIKHRLGLTSTRLYARECEVVEISKKEREEFFERCHLDGDVSSIIAFGLVNEGKLVAAISMRRPFHKKWNNRIEVARFANELDTVVVGGLSKLIKRATEWSKINEYAGIISYVDGRVGQGTSYTNSGFVATSSSEPMFWWTDFVRRYNRFKFRADKSRQMSERRVSEEAGVVRIYGCRNRLMLLDH